MKTFRRLIHSYYIHTNVLLTMFESKQVLLDHFACFPLDIKASSHIILSCIVPRSFYSVVYSKLLFRTENINVWILIKSARHSEISSIIDMLASYFPCDHWFVIIRACVYMYLWRNTAIFFFLNFKFFSWSPNIKLFYKHKFHRPLLVYLNLIKIKMKTSTNKKLISQRILVEYPHANSCMPQLWQIRL